MDYFNELTKQYDFTELFEGEHFTCDYPQAAIKLTDIFISRDKCSQLFHYLNSDKSLWWTKEGERSTLYFGNVPCSYGRYSNSSNIIWSDCILNILREENDRTGSDYDSIFINS